MHSIVLTSTLAALNDPSYMYAAVWPKIFLLYPYKMHFITFEWDKFRPPPKHQLVVKVDDLRLDAAIVHEPLSRGDYTLPPIGISRDRIFN